MTVYKVTVKKNCWIFDLERSEPMSVSFEYKDYDDVQNLIGYLIDGSNSVELEISKKEVE